MRVPNVLDPFTNKLGYGCQLTAMGDDDLAHGNEGVIYNTYKFRKSGNLKCSEVFKQTYK